jgi:hypothetical protein
MYQITKQVLGFREAITNSSYQSAGSKFGITPKLIAGVAAASFAVACAFGTKVGLDAHTPFLAGIGNLGDDMVLGLPFGRYNFISFLCTYFLVTNSCLQIMYL